MAIFYFCDSEKNILLSSNVWSEAVNLIQAKKSSVYERFDPEFISSICLNLKSFLHLNMIWCIEDYNSGVWHILTEHRDYSVKIYIPSNRMAENPFGEKSTRWKNLTTEIPDGENSVHRKIRTAKSHTAKNPSAVSM